VTYLIDRTLVKP